MKIEFTPSLKTVNNESILGEGNIATGGVVAPATNTADYLPQWNGSNSKTLKDGVSVPAGGLAGLTFVGTKQDKLTVVPVKIANYSANISEYVPCDISLGGFAVTLPNAPAEGTVVQVKVTKVDTTTVLEVNTSGADVFNAASGNTSIYLNLLNTVNIFTYQSSTKIWYVDSATPGSAFAIQFSGIDAQTPITNAHISIDTGAKVLTITPPLGYFYINIDGYGRNIRIRKTGPVIFPAFTDTSGIWYFYFDATGTAVTTQTPIEVDEFALNVSVYRILWNATLVGAAKLVAQYIEYNLNTISADTHRWFHLQGSQWKTGFVMKNNALTTSSPDGDGRNTVIALTTGENLNDNLAYTVTNSVAGTAWNQDMGQIVPASLNATNSGLFKVFVQDVAGLVSFLPATRFPFAWDAVSNRPEIISSTGVRTVVTDNRWFVYFIYSTPNPVSGDAVKVVSATSEFTSIVNARAFNWVDIQNTYPTLFGTDYEIRPLYRVIFYNNNSGAGAFPAGCKYSVIRETQDIRKAAVTSTTAATGSLPASSVTFVPAGNIGATNAQSALEELDLEKAPLLNPVFTGNVILGNASTDTLNVGNGGLVKDASGNVGIGTTSPIYPLDIYSATPIVRIMANAINTDSVIQLMENSFLGAEIRYTGATTNNIQFNFNSGSSWVTRAEINRDTGAFSVPATIQIGYPNYITSLLTLGISTNGDGILLDKKDSTNGSYSLIGFRNTAVAGEYTKGGIAYERTGAGGIGNMHFLTSSDSAIGNVNLTNAKLTITSAGNVGIGTTTPAGKLGIKGAGTTTGIALQTQDSTGAVKFKVLDNGNATLAGMLVIASDTPITKTADFAITNGEKHLINNKSGSTCLVTMPLASAFGGRSITIKNLQAQLVSSVASNIAPIDSATPGTAILLDVVGNWARLVSDGTNWIIMEQAPNNILLLE